jgi:hypothetical protein
MNCCRFSLFHSCLLFVVPFMSSYANITCNQSKLNQETAVIIAGARQIFHKNFFFFFVRKNSPGSEKKLYFEKFAGRLQYPMSVVLMINLHTACQLELILKSLSLLTLHRKPEHDSKRNFSYNYSGPNCIHDSKEMGHR